MLKIKGKRGMIFGWKETMESGAVSGLLPGGGRDIFRGWRKKFSGTSLPSAFFCFPTHYITNSRPLFFTV